MSLLSRLLLTIEQLLLPSNSKRGHSFHKYKWYFRVVIEGQIFIFVSSVYFIMSPGPQINAPQLHVNQNIRDEDCRSISSFIFMQRKLRTEGASVTIKAENNFNCLSSVCRQQHPSIRLQLPVVSGQRPGNLGGGGRLHQPGIQTSRPHGRPGDGPAAGGE